MNIGRSRVKCVRGERIAIADEAACDCRVAHENAANAIKFIDERGAVWRVLPRPACQSLHVDVKNLSHIEKDRETVNRAHSALHLRKPGFRPAHQSSERGLT